MTPANDTATVSVPAVKSPLAIADGPISDAELASEIIFLRRQLAAYEAAAGIRARRAAAAAEPQPVHHVEHVAGSHVRCFGVDVRYVAGKHGAQTVSYDRTFKVGDLAEYSSYNLSYYGRILSIGAKVVTIAAEMTGNRGDSRRLSIADFADRNRDFDAVETERRNHNTMMSI